MSESAADRNTAVRLFLGKGGAGKTTLAVKAALELARSGSRALVVSFDQAHSLGDVLGSATGHDAYADVVTVEPGLDVLELNTLALVESRYRTVTTILSMSGAGHEHGLRFGAVEPEEIIGAPGIAELLGLRRVVELVDENDWDTIFVDLPPTADSLRTLQLPELVCGYLERLWPQHDRIVAGTGTDPRLTVLVAMLERVVADAESVRELLFDRRRSTATVVMTPESVCVAETRRTLSAAALTGLPIDTVIVNKVLPQLNSSSIGLVGTHPAVFWFEAWRSAQQEALTEIEAMATGYSLVVIDRAAYEPVGLASLGALDARIGRDMDARIGGDMDARIGDTDARIGDPRVPELSDGVGVGHPLSERGADKPVVAHESGSGVESVYTMTMKLPIVDPATLELGRVGDDLIVGADGVRRRVRLASVLRRCDAVGAEFESGELVIRFRPDPLVWPA